MLLFFVLARLKIYLKFKEMRISILKRRLLICCVFSLLVLMFSCNHSSPGKPLYNASYILDTFPHFWKYWYYHVNFSRNYVVYDTTNKKIPRKEFFKKLITGQYLPLKLKSNSAIDHYKLIKVKEVEKKRDIYRYLAFLGKIDAKHNNLSEKPLPDFNFKALNGKEYTNKSCKGKIIVINCWFVGCHMCVKEMPELNKLVNKYGGDDIVFISLARSSKKSVKKFLSEHAFQYATVPDVGDYIEDSLQVRGFPTHVIINKKGIVLGFSNYVVNLKGALQQLVETGKLTMN